MILVAIALIIMAIGIGMMTLDGILRFLGVILIVASAIYISRLVMKAINRIAFGSEANDTEWQKTARYLTSSIMALLSTGLLHMVWFRSVTFSHQEVTPVIDRAGGIVITIGYVTFVVLMVLAFKTLYEELSYRRWKARQEANEGNT